MPMTMTSDTLSAGDAISKIVDVNNQSLTNEQVALDFSNITSMQNLVEVSNRMIGDMSNLITCVYSQAEKVQALAEKKAQDDAADVKTFSGPLWEVGN